MPTYTIPVSVIVDAKSPTEAYKKLNEIFSNPDIGWASETGWCEDDTLLLQSEEQEARDQYYASLEEFEE